ncbi:MAG: inner membrane-spanning protein YciB [Nevskiales bacterium]
MIHALRALLSDFLSTLVFLAIATATGDPRLAIIAGMATGLAQLVLQRMRRREVGATQWAGLVLTLAFGGAALALHDPRFVMAKPSVIHAALGAVMLRRGWMARYLPERAVSILPPALVIGAGHMWAALMFALSAANLVVALTLPLWVWAWFISIGAFGAKLVMLLGQYVLFRRTARGIIRQRNAIAVTA